MRVRFWQVWATAFNDKDTTFGNGINISGANYEVHRFYEEDGNLFGSLYLSHPRNWQVCCRPRPCFTPTCSCLGTHPKTFRAIPDSQLCYAGLIYGRTHSVDPREGEGFCLARANKSTSGLYSPHPRAALAVYGRFMSPPPPPTNLCARVIRTCNLS